MTTTKIPASQLHDGDYVYYPGTDSVHQVREVRHEDFKGHDMVHWTFGFSSHDWADGTVALDMVARKEEGS